MSKATIGAKTWEIRSLKRRLKLMPGTETLLLAVMVGILGGLGVLAFKKLIFGL